MKHASPAALDLLDDTLCDLRELPGLKEKTRGVFYRGGKAFLHFHEDPSGLYADIRRDALFERFPVNSADDKAGLLAVVRSALGV
jgi:hypothetical protein